MNFLEITSQYQGLINLLFSGVVAVSTVVYALLTRTLVAETRLLRRVQTEPSLATYIIPHPDVINLVLMEIKNLGMAPAYSIEWQIDADAAELESRGVRIHKASILKSLRYLPPGRDFRFTFGIGPRLLTPEPLRPFDLLVTYKSASGDTFSQRFTIDVSELLGLRQAGTSAQYKIAQSLEKIENHLANVGRGWTYLKVLTTDEKTYRKRISQEIRFDRAVHQARTITGALAKRIRAFINSKGTRTVPEKSDVQGISTSDFGKR